MNSSAANTEIYSSNLKIPFQYLAQVCRNIDILLNSQRGKRNGMAKTLDVTTTGT